MTLRDAVPEDAERLAELADRGHVDVAMAPRSLRDMIRDRTVVVAEREDGDGGDGDGDGGRDGDRSGDVEGYVSYDVQEDAVVIHHVVAETDEAREALFERPLSFADREELAAVIGLKPDDPAVDLTEDRGFTVVERRSFGGDQVVRYERPASDE